MTQRGADTALAARPRVRRSPACTCGALSLALLLLTLCLLGCDKEPKAPPHVTTKPVGESTTHLDGDPVPEEAVRPVMFPRVAQAPKPTTLPSNATCVTPECHAKMATAKHIHGPIAAGSCFSCHREGTGGHKYPLKRQGTATCTFCHAVGNTRAHQHAAITQQGCTACHRPHESDTKYLLVAETVDRVCAQCHDIPLKKNAHSPFAKGECTVCHDPHESNATKLLRGGDGSEHCFMCHGQLKEAMAQVPHVHRPARQACTTCHGPHSTDYAHQLRQPVNQTCLTCHKKIGQHLADATVKHGALDTGDGCANCHNPHGSSQSALLRQRQNALCLDCHDKQMTALDGHTIANMKPALTAANLHGPVRAGDCSACHDPHGAKQPNLLLLSFPKPFYASFDLNNYALCFRCHDQNLVLSERTAHLTEFRDGDRNLHYVHVHRDEKGRTCKTCHAIHGSDLPNHIADSVPFEGSNWAMPIRYEKRADGGSCTPGCHDPRSYSRTRPAPTTQPMTRGEQ